MIGECGTRRAGRKKGASEPPWDSNAQPRSSDARGVSLLLFFPCRSRAWTDVLRETWNTFDRIQRVGFILLLASGYTIHLPGSHPSSQLAIMLVACNRRPATNQL